MSDATPFPAALWTRFWAKVDASGDCWIWTRARGSRGYGSVHIRPGETALAHRTAWEMLVGAIPDEMTIDHRCFNLVCVNPDHLEVVTRAENTRRIRSHPSSRKMKCPEGHAYNMIDGTGARACRECRRHQSSLARNRRLAEAGIPRVRQTSTWTRSGTDGELMANPPVAS